MVLPPPWIQNITGQAFRYGDRVYGIEFHPEMTREMIDRWSNSERGGPKIERFKDKGARPRDTHHTDYERYAAASDRWLNHFLDKHLLVREQQNLRATA
jgi:GMP synthase (glutamine-hydrolysing)